MSDTIEKVLGETPESLAKRLRAIARGGTWNYPYIDGLLRNAADMIDELQARAVRAEGGAKALRRYGHHDFMCESLIPDKPHACTCGLDAALAKNPNGAKANIPSADGARTTDNGPGAAGSSTNPRRGIAAGNTPPGVAAGGAVNEIGSARVVPNRGALIGRLQRAARAVEGGMVRDALDDAISALEGTPVGDSLPLEGSADIGFDKVLYQLLLHKVGKKYGKQYRIEVFLDQRNAEQDPEALRPMLNSALSKRYGITTNPFRVIRFIDSKHSSFIQAADLITGAIATRKNELHLRPGAAKCKVELGNVIARGARDLEFPAWITGPFAKRFTLWHFKYRARGGFLGR